MELASLLSPELEPDVDDILAEHLEIYSDNFLPDHVNRMCLADARMFLPGLNLATPTGQHGGVDRGPSTIRRPGRVPGGLLAHGRHKVSGRSGKVALKHAARAWLPDEIINRPKASFSAPLRAWVRRDLRELIDDVLVGGELVSTGFIRPEASRSLIEDDRSGRAGPLQANLATAHPRAVVPAGEQSGRGRLEPYGTAKFEFEILTPE